MDNRTLAIEFTITHATALQLSYSTTADDLETRRTGATYRVLVPKVQNMDTEIEVFFRDTNELGEAVWSPVTNTAQVVAGLKLWRRIVIALAFQALYLKGPTDQLARATETANGSLRLDLGEV